VLQLLLGIFTVMHADNTRSLLWWGVAHQFVAMLLLVSLVVNVFVLRPARS
jgi:heme A synthase